MLIISCAVKVKLQYKVSLPGLLYFQMVLSSLKNSVQVELHNIGIQRELFFIDNINKANIIIVTKVLVNLKAILWCRFALVFYFRIFYNP